MNEPMTDKISYFEVTSFLADIEAEYANVGDSAERTQSLVDRLLSKWPSKTPEQTVAWVQVFEQAD